MFVSRRIFDGLNSTIESHLRNAQRLVSGCVLLFSSRGELPHSFLPIESMKHGVLFRAADLSKGLSSSPRASCAVQLESAPLLEIFFRCQMTACICFRLHFVCLVPCPRGDDSTFMACTSACTTTTQPHYALSRTTHSRDQLDRFWFWPLIRWPIRPCLMKFEL